MTKREILEKEGTLIEEIDLYDSLYREAYDGYLKIYLWENQLYHVEHHKNAFQYNGKENSTELITDNVTEDLKKYNEDFFKFYYRVSKEGYKKLKKIVTGE